MLIALLLAIPVFRPLMQALDNPALSWQERAVVATDLLNLHARYWPWALGALTVLTIHCLHSLRTVHRIAGPLYRFKQLYREIGEGNLSIRATLRQHDYLTPEADLLNRMTAQLQARVSASKQAQAVVALDVERLKEAVAREHNPILATLVQQTEQDLASLKESLDWFKTHKG
jgi:methyl-accepting chemotaxis protein